MSWARGSEEGNWRESHEALLAVEESHDSTEKTRRRPVFNPSVLRSIATINSLIFLACGLLGFLSGWFCFSYLPTELTLPGATPRVSIDNVLEIFSSHPEYMSPPPLDNSSEPYWDALLPKGLGYVNSPLAQENVSTISVFHQLHCLYTLRRIYYATLAKTLDKQNQKHELAPFDNGVERPKHAAHCFEYLRQSLMCNADSSLEPFESTQDDFPGMGFQRQCRDYGALRRYAEEYRILDAQGFIFEGVDIHGRRYT